MDWYQQPGVVSDVELLHKAAQQSEVIRTEYVDKLEELETDLFMCRHWPLALSRATMDCWGHTIGMDDGSVIRFTSCAPRCSGHWVFLQDPEFISGPIFEKVGLSRGIEIKVSSITWVAEDAS